MFEEIIYGMNVFCKVHHKLIWYLIATLFAIIKEFRISYFYIKKFLFVDEVYVWIFNYI